MKRFRRQSILHMLREEKQNRNRGFLPDRSVFRWILISFSIASLVFCVVLIPLAAYCQNVFTELEYQKINQKLDSGISQINNTVTNLNELSKIFSENPYFIPIRYSNADYAAIDETTRLQMKYFYSDLVFPLSLVTDSALLFSQNVAITPANVFLNDMQEGSHFYPDYFCVNHLSYEEWNELLSEKKTGFLPVSQVNTKTQTYDALIYIAPLLKSPYFHAWTKSSYLYATIKIEDIQQILIHESDLDSIYLHITDKNENILYSNLTGCLCQKPVRYLVHTEIYLSYQNEALLSLLGDLYELLHSCSDYYHFDQLPAFQQAHCNYDRAISDHHLYPAKGTAGPFPGKSIEQAVD